MGQERPVDLQLGSQDNSCEYQLVDVDMRVMETCMHMNTMLITASPRDSTDTHISSGGPVPLHSRSRKGLVSACLAMSIITVRVHSDLISR